jgi:Resolvase, N terminal domain
VLTTVNEFRDRGIKVVSLTENFDLDTKEGRFMFAVLAAAAEYELELRAERQAEGIAAARRRQESGQMLPGNKRMGRPNVIGLAELATLRRMVEPGGVSVTEAARTSRSAAPPLTPLSRPADSGRRYTPTPEPARSGSSSMRSTPSRGGRGFPVPDETEERARSSRPTTRRRAGSGPAAAVRPGRQRLRGAGAEFTSGPAWTPHVVVDGNLITGQNPASSEAAAEAILKELATRA